MNYLVTEPWCDNCYPVNAALICAVKSVIANFMLLITCSLWSEIHFCQFFLIPWFVADQHVQQNTWGLEGIQQQCKCWDWFWVFLWRYRCWAWSCWGGFREAFIQYSQMRQLDARAAQLQQCIHRWQILGHSFLGRFRKSLDACVLPEMAFGYWGFQAWHVYGARAIFQMYFSGAGIGCYGWFIKSLSYEICICCGQEL